MKKIFSSRFARNTCGSTILEFAIIAPILLLLIAGIVQYSLVLFGQATMNAAVIIGARELKTSNDNNSTDPTYNTLCQPSIGTTQSQIQYINCIVGVVSGSLFDKTQLQISAKAFTDYNTITPPAACTNNPISCTSVGPPAVPPGCGTPVCSEDFGSPGNIVEFTVSYPWPIVMPFVSSFFSGGNISSGGLGIYNISASTIVRNEPTTNTGDTLTIVTTVPSH